MNLGKLLKSGVNAIKKNPDKALIVAAVIAPGLAAKVLPKALPVIEALRKKAE